MTKEFEIKTDFSGCKTYATKENVRKAVSEKGFDELPIRWFIMIKETEKGNRYFPVFVGTESVHHGIHHHFHCIS